MSRVHYLPNAAAPAIWTVRRGGRFPKGVVSLNIYRMRCKSAALRAVERAGRIEQLQQEIAYCEGRLAGLRAVLGELLCEQAAAGTTARGKP